MFFLSFFLRLYQYTKAVCEMLSVFLCYPCDRPVQDARWLSPYDSLDRLPPQMQESQINVWIGERVYLHVQYCF